MLVITVGLCNVMWYWASALSHSYLCFTGGEAVYIDSGPHLNSSIHMHSRVVSSLFTLTYQTLVYLVKGGRGLWKWLEIQHSMPESDPGGSGLESSSAEKPTDCASSC